MDMFFTWEKKKKKKKKKKKQSDRGRFRNSDGQQGAPGNAYSNVIRIRIKRLGWAREEELEKLVESRSEGKWTRRGPSIGKGICGCDVKPTVDSTSWPRRSDTYSIHGTYIQ